MHLPLLQAFRHVHPDDQGKTLSYLRDRITHGERNFRMDLRILRDNEYVWSEVIAKISLKADGKLRKLAGIIIDIPERKEKEEKLYREATRDPLTGIANRGSFDNHFLQLKREFDQDGTAFSLLLLDVDHFKRSMTHGAMAWAIRP